MPENRFQSCRNTPQKNGTRRCDTCNGRFGLIRHRFSQKQFCSKQCLDNYKSNAGRDVSSSKQWIDFLEASERRFKVRVD
jgi:hypothetical protein